jgi:uncharacterized protein YunC (DUF1805 family)
MKWLVNLGGEHKTRPFRAGWATAGTCSRDMAYNGEMDALDFREGRGFKMMTMTPIELDGHTVIGIEVKLPKTTLIAVTTDKGYIMCGALDIGLLNDRLKDRGIIAARAVGVKTLQQLLDAPMESVTHEAAALGVVPGISGREAIVRML